MVVSETVVINCNGVAVKYEAAVMLMDDDLREELHSRLAPCSEQKFFSAYETEHEKRFGSVWVCSRAKGAW